MALRIDPKLKLLLAALLVTLPPSCGGGGDDDGGDGEVQEDDTCTSDSDCGMGCSSGGHEICNGAECVVGCRKDAECATNEHCQTKCTGGCSNECAGTCKPGKRQGKEPPCDC